MLPENRRRVEAIFASRPERDEAKDRELIRKMHTDGEPVTLKLAGGERTLTNLEDKIKVFASWRIERIQSMILGTNVGLDFFDVVNLTGDELPVIINNNPTMKPIKFHSTTAAGRTYNSPPIEYGQETVIEPMLLTSDEASYDVKNIRLGKTTSEIINAVDERIAKSLDIEIDKLCWELIESAMKPVFSSPTNYYIFDDRVTSFPTSNIIAAPSNGLPGISPRIFKNIGRHINLLGAGVQLRNLYIPAQDYASIWDWPEHPTPITGGTPMIKPTETVPDSVKDTIWNTGALPVILFGHRCNLVITNTRASGAVYFNTNVPVGKMFTKTEMDDTKTDDKVFDTGKVRTRLEKWLAMAVLDTNIPYVGKALYNP